MLVLLDSASALEENAAVSPLPAFLLDAVIGWAGAILIYFHICSFYSLSSAVTVALGIYEMWQFPPLVGDVRDAWSAKQFWAVDPKNILNSEDIVSVYAGLVIFI
ncbi:uncharacterized protein EKO05_0001201 [Ascochyta rabiei]|uniref:uncharacterized protein n=1 Tax=Didymella rabiei TaxID=5454 RepID=UPI00220D106E|nr:uncharacterized protein EKO05_0001201 [Ascochyta rabiei]UPX10549.1 hypothetical protein EKO05_0001201 [Ascochyta rabiei]